MPILSQNAARFVPGGVGEDFWEPQRQNNFAAIFEVNGLSGGAAAKDILMLSLKTFPFPTEGNERKSLRHQNGVVHYAGAQTDIEEISLVYRDYVDKRVADLWQSWRSQVYNIGNGNVGWASKYKVNGYLYKLPPGNFDDMNTPVDLGGSYVRTWILEGCYPSSYKESDYSAEDDGTQTEITINMSIDRVKADSVYDPSNPTRTTVGKLFDAYKAIRGIFS